MFFFTLNQHLSLKKLLLKIDVSDDLLSFFRIQKSHQKKLVITFFSPCTFLVLEFIIDTNTIKFGLLRFYSYRWQHWLKVFRILLGKTWQTKLFDLAFHLFSISSDNDSRNKIRSIYNGIEFFLQTNSIGK